jgi:hypothetical protein
MAKGMARLNAENVVINMESWDDYAPESDTLKNPIGVVTMGDIYNPIDKRFYRNNEKILTEIESKLADAEAALTILGVIE